ncbi:uncharacterized protein TNCV_1106391 [Trichonephila clavipes]|nr:uncharacterized protein TNCV_1106391 [Trichonephila clavipes]
MAVAANHKSRNSKRSGLLAEEPPSIIKHIPISENTYEEAWGKLLNDYDRKTKLLPLQLKHSQIKLPSHANSVNLRQLADTSDEIICGLKSLGQEASSRDIWLIYLLLQKLDSDTRQWWHQKTANEELPSLDSFLEFLNSGCVSLEIFNNNGIDSEFKSNFSTQNCSSRNMTTVVIETRLGLPSSRRMGGELILFQSQFKALGSVQIPRWLHTTSKVINLYGFCDASELSYSAVTHCSQPDGNNHPVNIMVAKTKVHPIKHTNLYLSS